METVSVVIPCFRSEATILRAVRSAAEQTAAPRQIILVDDGGGLDAVDALHRNTALFAELIEVVSLDRNRGPGAARNAGWARATGSLVAFLDADDSWHPRKLELQAAAMAANPRLTLLGTGALTLRTPEPLSDSSSAVETAPQLVAPRSLLWSNPFLTSSVVVRAGIDQRFTEVRTEAEDYDLWLAIVRSGGLAGKLPGRLAFRHKAPYGAGGLSAQMRTMQRKELATLRRARQAGLASGPQVTAASAWSCAKFARRIALLRLQHRTASDDVVARA